MRGWENIFHINGPTGKQEFQCSIEQNRLENQCQKDKEGHYDKKIHSRRGYYNHQIYMHLI